MKPDHLEEFLESKIGDCKHFKWSEALWLPTWQIHVLPDEDVAKNIIETANKLESIRAILGKPIKVTSWYRPAEYNKAIGGAKLSAHQEGLACDFHAKGLKADAVREILVDYLARLDIRMEDLEGANWVHIDLKSPSKNGRFFKP